MNMNILPFWPVNLSDDRTNRGSGAPIATVEIVGQESNNVSDSNGDGE